jgi:hypothetical protein
MDITKKYVMSNIKIPIEIKENNKCEPYMDLLQMEITPLYHLPDPITDTVLKEQLKQNLYIFLSKMFPEHRDEIPSSSPEQINVIQESKPNSESEQNPNPESESIHQIYIDKEEIKRLKKPMNTTFKTYNKKTCKKYTIKNYDNNGL